MTSLVECANEVLPPYDGHTIATGLTLCKPFRVSFEYQVNTTAVDNPADQDQTKNMILVGDVNGLGSQYMRPLLYYFEGGYVTSMFVEYLSSI